MCWSIWINYRKPLLSAKAVCDDELWRVFVWKWSDTLNTGQKHFWLLPSLTMLTYRYPASLLIFALMMIVLLFLVFKIAYLASLESSYFLVFCLYLAMYLVMLFLDDFTILLFNLFNSWVVRSLSEFPRIWNDVHHTISWKELTALFYWYLGRGQALPENTFHTTLGSLVSVQFVVTQGKIQFELVWIKVALHFLNVLETTLHRLDAALSINQHWHTLYKQQFLMTKTLLKFCVSIFKPCYNR